MIGHGILELSAGCAVNVSGPCGCSPLPPPSPPRVSHVHVYNKQSLPKTTLFAAILGADFAFHNLHMAAAACKGGCCKPAAAAAPAASACSCGAACTGAGCTCGCQKPAETKEGGCCGSSGKSCGDGASKCPVGVGIIHGHLNFLDYAIGLGLVGLVESQTAASSKTVAYLGGSLVAARGTDAGLVGVRLSIPGSRRV